MLDNVTLSAVFLLICQHAGLPVSVIRPSCLVAVPSSNFHWHFK